MCRRALRICYRLLAIVFAERERASGEFARSVGRPDTRPGNPFFLREEIESHSSEQPSTLRNANSLLTNEFGAAGFRKSSRFAVHRSPLRPDDGLSGERTSRPAPRGTLAQPANREL
jgi:hypothetical protein